jgi:hypothetical protein
MELHHRRNRTEAPPQANYNEVVLRRALTLGLLVTAEGFSEAAKRRAAAIRGMGLDVVELDELQKWLPRRPVVGRTAGASTATLSCRDDEGVIRTSVVDTDLAGRLVTERGYGAAEESRGN